MKMLGDLIGWSGLGEKNLIQEASRQGQTNFGIVGGCVVFIFLFLKKLYISLKKITFPQI
jgi:hypothetical protein